MTQPPQFTEPVGAALESAFLKAQGKKHTEINENHLLLCFFEDPQGYFSTIANSLGLNPSDLISALKSQLEQTPVYSGAAQAPLVSASLQQKISQAQEIAKNGKTLT